MTRKSHHFTKVNDTYNQFKVENIVDIDELQCQLIELVHIKTGAKVLHIANEDTENTFCLSFQTTPTSSNGVAHILEHTVLCGSKKFPVKDPFFAMQRRSLNTFMNALTGADFTCYPAATQVPKDFYNLLDVYLDAVFHPKLDILSFLQEGHRLEFSHPNDSTSPIEFKGIVFNEMKGAMASPSTRLNEAISSALFPDITYGINSGGDPLEIPTLTYQELLDFHHTYYQPSRCLFFFYGNLPIEGHLDFIEERILKEATAENELPPIPLQKRFSEPRRLLKRYPASPEDSANDATHMALGWLTTHILNQKETLALDILQIILLDTDASPLKLALLKSGLCKQVASFMDDEISEIPFIITLKGCDVEDQDKIESEVRVALRAIVEEGIPLHMVENAIHQLEFHRSEITGDHAPFGLSLFMRSALIKQHGGKAEYGLKIHSLFDEVREENLKNPKFFTDLIHKYLLDNPHFVRVTLVPDKNLDNEELAKEKALLQKIEKTLTKEKKEAIIKETKALEEVQKMQEDEDTDVLPKITLSDIPHQGHIFDLQQEIIDGHKVFHHKTFTNHIVYADLVFDLPKIEEEDLSILRFFSTLLSQMGCGKRNYAENLEYIQAHTGGVSASLAFNLSAFDTKKIAPSICIRGKALHRNTPHLFSLLLEMTKSVDFKDLHRLKEIIHKQYTNLQSHFTQQALKYAIHLSAKGFDVPSKISNKWHGLEYYQMIKSFAEDFQGQKDYLIERLEYLKTILFKSNVPDLVIASDANAYDEIKRSDFYGLCSYKSHPHTAWKSDYPLEKIPSQGRAVASPVAFIAQVLHTVPYTHEAAPALSVASFLMDNTYLHQEIREKGGAYGGGASCNALSGIFYFYSFRDPNIATTLNAFEKATQKIIKGHFDATDIEEAQIEMIQALDSPIAPGSRADQGYGWLREERSEEIRQQFRERLLALKKDEIVKATEEHILVKQKNATSIVFAQKELLEKENQKLITEGKKAIPIVF